LAAAITWGPIAVLALHDGSYGGGAVPTNFFADFAAYVQLLIALPLFVIVEPVMDRRTRDVADQLIACGIVRPGDVERLDGAHAQIARLRKAWWPDLVCVLFAFGLSLVILVPEFGPHPLPTWHVRNYAHWRTLTDAGAWAFLVALPILNYTWLRFIWKIMLWVLYLWHIRQLRLDLHPTHPDMTGGIGFISEAQGHFALFILAYGIGNIAAPVGYEIAVLHYDSSVLTVWGPPLSFAIGAPLLFTLPLFMFTRQLYDAKRRALGIYRARVTDHSRMVEREWSEGDRGKTARDTEIRDLAELNTLSTLFTQITRMRVVPLDLRSFGQLIGSSFGSMATLLPLLHFEGRTTGLFDLAGKLLGHLGG
jgi:hypothetical protein